ncbi:AAA family ATPase [Gordonia sp. TBRC 11910]|uniref:AAA family ATPase n=1 Tax=Gordonia asplenii TaxID=2725283 RepID=A0A848KZW2_9ACTN|nr:AAA family ATPase [Gordonia asplenii]NMO04250.1 AAA family ATPase [Gordonia asplenii]
MRESRAQDRSQSLIWINGAFGAGKTQTAFELHRRIDNGFVSDPELIGFGIHRMLPAKARGDFQDRPQWRSSVIATLADAVEAHDGPTIVPMTLVDTDYFDEIMDGLSQRGVDVRHFSLIASPETLRRRLRTRLAHGVGRLFGREETWAMQQIDRCSTALSDKRFGVHVPTDERTVDEVVEDIAQRAGLDLVRPRLSSVRYQVRRVRVGVAHIR